VSAHLGELLALDAAGVLEPAERARVAAHLAACAECAREAESWRRLARGLGELPALPPPAALGARTREAVAAAFAERSERAWNRAALGFLVAFAWTLAALSWFLFEIVTGGLALRLGRPVGPTVAWYAAYVVSGWLAAAVAAALAGRRAGGEGRIA
jgi:anti-sigma factor RsiW